MDIPLTDPFLLPSAAAGDNASLVRGAPSYLESLIGYNAAAYGIFLKVYNKRTAPQATDAPKMVFYLPAGSPFAIPLYNYFSSGLGFRLVKGADPADATPILAGDILGLNIGYR